VARIRHRSASPAKAKGFRGGDVKCQGHCEPQLGRAASPI
jgi:hypothetical protein